MMGTRDPIKDFRTTLAYLLEAEKQAPWHAFLWHSRETIEMLAVQAESLGLPAPLKLVFSRLGMVEVASSDTDHNNAASQDDSLQSNGAPSKWTMLHFRTAPPDFGEFALSFYRACRPYAPRSVEPRFDPRVAQKLDESSLPAHIPYDDDRRKQVRTRQAERQREEFDAAVKSVEEVQRALVVLLNRWLLAIDSGMLALYFSTKGHQNVVDDGAAKLDLDDIEVLKALHRNDGQPMNADPLAIAALGQTETASSRDRERFRRLVDSGWLGSGTGRYSQGYWMTSKAHRWLAHRFETSGHADQLS